MKPRGKSPCIFGLADEAGNIVYVTRTFRLSPEEVLTAIVNDTRGGKSTSQDLREWLNDNVPTLVVLEQLGDDIAKEGLEAALTKWVALIKPSLNMVPGKSTYITDVLRYYRNGRPYDEDARRQDGATSRHLRLMRGLSTQPASKLFWNY